MIPNIITIILIIVFILMAGYNLDSKRYGEALIMSLLAIFEMVVYLRYAIEGLI